MPLSCSGGWILVRGISSTTLKDGMGCYPIFSCSDWSSLPNDLRSIGQEGLVALSLVADPFGDHTPKYLSECFNARALPFKEHFVVDLSQSLSGLVASHHRRYARKGLRDLVIEHSMTPDTWIDQWVELYAHLTARHGITGVSAFSPVSFAKQLTVPGIHAFRARRESTIVGMLLWYVRGEVGYYHLGAYSPLGYELHASFPLFWYAIEYFADSGLRWLNLGAGAGVKNDGKDGLSSFKRGWASGTKTAYLCGHICNRDAYHGLVTERGLTTSYFPAYRHGEFG